MLIALASMCIGVAATPLMQQSWQFVLLWGFMVGSGAGFTANVLAATVAMRWFKARLGMVVGLLASATAAGQLLLLPLLASIAANFGWRLMALAVAAAAFCSIPLAVALLMRDRPEDIGLTGVWRTAGRKCRGAEQRQSDARGAFRSRRRRRSLRGISGCCRGAFSCAEPPPPG